MKKSAADLRKEVTGLDKPEDAKMKSFFEKTLNECTTLLEVHDKKVTEYQDTVQFYGELSSNDIAGFFQNWNKFVTNFRAAVKFNIALAKKREAEKKKEKEEKMKKKEEENVKKFTDTLRASRKHLPGEMLKQGEMMDKEAKGSVSAGRRRKTRTKKKPSTSVVDEILSDNIEVLSGPSADIRDDNGVVKQISKGLRSGDTFSRLRGKRMATAAAKKEATGDVTPDKAAASTRRKLRSQQSTFSRRDGNRAKKKTSAAAAAAEPSESKAAGGRTSIASINWG